MSYTMDTNLLWQWEPDTGTDRYSDKSTAGSKCGFHIPISQFSSSILCD